MVNKKGWIKIVEVFIAILLITTIILMVIEEREDGKNYSARIYEIETKILREIELNETLRSEILNSSVPVEWGDFDSQLSNVKEKIISRTPEYLTCEAKLCEIDDVCSLNETVEKDIYTNPVTIFANLTTYNPRQLKLFCWEK